MLGTEVEMGEIISCKNPNKSEIRTENLKIIWEVIKHKTYEFEQEICKTGTIPKIYRKLTVSDKINRIN